MNKTVDPLSVAFLTTSFPLSGNSTSGLFIKRLVDHLPEHIDVTVITPSSADAETVHDQCGIRIMPYRYAPKSWQTLAHRPGGIPVALKANRFALVLLPGLLIASFICCVRIAGKVDLIHANWSVNGVIAGIAGIFTRTPVVTTLRGSDVNKAQKSQIYSMLLRSCLRLSRKVVTVSDSIQRMVLGLYPGLAAKVSMIPNGVESDFIELARRRRVSYTGPLHLITIGNLVPNKGIDVILRSLTAFDVPAECTLTIVGDGPLATLLEELAKELQIQDRVTFLGRRSPAEILEQLLSADIFVLASYSEGRPNVLLEAMASGLPIIASNIAGVDELIEHERTGLLFAPGNHRDLRGQIDRLTEDGLLRRRLASAAHRFVVDNELLWPVAGMRYAQLYEEVALEQKSRACAA